MHRLLDMIIFFTYIESVNILQLAYSAHIDTNYESDCAIAKATSVPFK